MFNLAYVDELRANSYVEGDEKRKNRDEKAGAAEDLRGLRDQVGERREGSGVQRELEKERGGLGGEARAERPAQSLLGRAGTEAERKSALTEHFAQGINDAYAAGKIDRRSIARCAMATGPGGGRGVSPKTRRVPEGGGMGVICRNALESTQENLRPKYSHSSEQRGGLFFAKPDTKRGSGVGNRAPPASLPET